MTVSLYYIAPWEAQLWSLGGGQFTNVDPGDGRKVWQGSRVLIYGTWQTDVTGHYSETVKPGSGRGRAKGTCVSYVQAPDVDPLGLHDAIATDSAIVRVPWTPANLDAPWSTLTAQQQTAAANYLESIFMDAQWIGAATPFRSVMSYFLHVMFAAQQLGADYPDGPLTGRWNSFTPAQTAAVQAFLSAFSLPAISGNPTRREVINRLAQADYGTNNPRMGGVQFGAWTP